MVVENRKRIRCVVVAVPAETDAWSSRGALAHDLVPDADPYVAQLIKRLQDEVRRERCAQARVRRVKRAPINRLAASKSASADLPFGSSELSDDLEIPWFDMPEDDDPLIDDGDTSPEFRSDSNDDAVPRR